jgi:hypothetical protein
LFNQAGNLHPFQCSVNKNYFLRKEIAKNTAQPVLHAKNDGYDDDDDINAKGLINHPFRLPPNPNPLIPNPTPVAVAQMVCDP